MVFSLLSLSVFSLSRWYANLAPTMASQDLNLRRGECHLRPIEASSRRSAFSEYCMATFNLSQMRTTSVLVSRVFDRETHLQRSIVLDSPLVTVYQSVAPYLPRVSPCPPLARSGPPSDSGLKMASRRYSVRIHRLVPPPLAQGPQHILCRSSTPVFLSPGRRASLQDSTYMQEKPQWYTVRFVFRAPLTPQF